MKPTNEKPAIKGGKPIPKGAGKKGVKMPPGVKSSMAPKGKASKSMPFAKKK